MPDEIATSAYQSLSSWITPLPPPPFVSFPPGQEIILFFKLPKLKNSDRENVKYTKLFGKPQKSFLSKSLKRINFLIK